MQLLTESKTLGKIYEPEEVFTACKEKLGELISDVMYMHSDDENNHYFKDITTRKYTKITLK